MKRVGKVDIPQAALAGLAGRRRGGGVKASYSMRYDDSMKRRQILLDEQSEKILDRLAAPHAGNRSLAVREMLKTQHTIEALLDKIEADNHQSLRRQKERSESGFREGTFTPWKEVERLAGRMKRA